MISRISAAFAVTALMAAPAALAQDQADAPEILLELNTATDGANGSCLLTYVATNRTDQELSQLSYQVGIFDASGIVTRLVVFEFGAFSQGRTKIIQFDMGGTPCNNISRIVVNEVAACTLATDASPAGFCIDALTTSSRTAIQFSL